MSTTESNPKGGASFLTLIGAFFGFAVLLYLVVALFGSDEIEDPKMEERLAIKEEILGAQNEIMDQTGLTDEAKREALFAKAAKELAGRSASKSGMVIPGSPTQLKQAEAAAAAAPAPADDAAPSEEAAPAN